MTDGSVSGGDGHSYFRFRSQPGDVGPEVVDALPHPVVAIGPDGAILWCNRAFRVAFLLGDRTLDGFRLFAVRDWLFDEPALHEALSAVREGRPEATCTLSRDGRTVHEVTVRLLPSAGDGASLLTFTDVSGKASAEAERRRYRSQLAIVNEVIRASASRLTTDEILAAVLERTVSLLGFDAGAVYLLGGERGVAHLSAAHGLCDLVFEGSPFLRLDTPPLDAVLEGRACYTETYLDVEHDEGELGVFSSATVPVLADGRTIGLIAVASTSFHRFSPLEREVLEAIGAEIGGAVRRGELEEASIREHRAAELYLDLISHDLGNLQTAALAYAEDLRESGAPAAPLVETLRRGLSIVRQIGTLRRIGSTEGVLEPVRLLSAIDSARVEAGETEVRVDGDGTVLADALLPEVFANLFANSHKFGATRILVRVRELPDGTEVRVEDDGPGISDEEKDRVFLRYQAGPHPASGSGLGLSLVSLLMERYRGVVVVEDRVPGHPGEGAAFVLRFRRPG